MTGLHMKHAPHELWRCPTCHRPFAQKPHTHACGKWTVADHFAGKPRAWVVYEALIEACREHGAVKAVAAEAHITLESRLHAPFAEVVPHSGFVQGRLLLTAPRKHAHAFELHAPDELDERFLALLRDAYISADR